MPWTKNQRITMGIACSQANISDEHRKLILKQRTCPRTGKCRAMLPNGGVSSTASGLTNTDFEQCMATVEHVAGGKLKGYSHSYWSEKAADGMQRPRKKAQAMANILMREGVIENGLNGLRGWIKHITNDEADTIDRCSYDQLHALINSFRALARRNGVDLKERVA